MTQKNVQVNTGASADLQQSGCQADRAALGAMCAAFEAYVKTYDFAEFADLTFLLDRLPLLRLREGYALGAFVKGDDFDAVFQTYCYRADAQSAYLPTVVREQVTIEEGKSLFGLLSRPVVRRVRKSWHVPYVDTQYIDRRLSEDEAADVPSIWSYVDVPFTAEGLVQACLLQHLNEFMPRFWRSCGGTKTLVFSPDRLKHLVADGEVDDPDEASRLLALDGSDLLPKVDLQADTASVTFAFWDSWRGLVVSSDQLVREGRSVRFTPPPSHHPSAYRYSLRYFDRCADASFPSSSSSAPCLPTIPTHF